MWIRLDGDAESLTVQLQNILSLEWDSDNSRLLVYYHQLNGDTITAFLYGEKAKTTYENETTRLLYRPTNDPVDMDEDLRGYREESDND